MADTRGPGMGCAPLADQGTGSGRRKLLPPEPVAATSQTRGRWHVTQAEQLGLQCHLLRHSRKDSWHPGSTDSHTCTHAHKHMHNTLTHAHTHTHAHSHTHSLTCRENSRNPELNAGRSQASGLKVTREETPAPARTRVSPGHTAWLRPGEGHWGLPSVRGVRDKAAHALVDL